MSGHELKLDPLALREKWRELGKYHCFWSGLDNPKGFQLTPSIQPGCLWVDMTIEQHHSGFPGIANGGVAFVLLDGLMSWCVMAHEGRAGFTTGASIHYKAPLVVSNTYRFQVHPGKKNSAQRTTQVSGEILSLEEPESNRKPLIKMTGEFFLPDRKTAEAVLGFDLGEEGKEVFPED